MNGGGDDSALIGAIYDTVIGEDDAGLLARQLTRAFGAHSVIFYHADRATGRHDRIVTTVPSEVLLPFVPELDQIDLWLRGGLSTKFWKPLVGEELVAECDLVASRFYNELLAQVDIHHLLAEVGSFDGDRVSVIGLHRPRNAAAFGNAELAKLKIVFPHIVRAERVRRRLEAANRIAQLGLAALEQLEVAAIVCDAKARVLFANQAARAFDRAASGIRLSASPREPLLAATHRETTQALRRAVATAAQVDPDLDCGGMFRVPRGQDEPSLIAVVAPLSPRMGVTEPLARVLVNDPLSVDRRFEWRVRQAFHLTPAEARLAAALASGVSRSEYASQHGVRPSTVKTQLDNLFMKLDCRRETELVRVLLSVPRLFDQR